MSQEGQTGREKREIIEVESIESLREALTQERVRAGGLLANWQRAQADFINYKRRSEQEKEETSNLAKSALVLSLLPVLDDLERALASVPPRLTKHPWVDGISIISGKFRAILAALGVSPVKALGEPFDPNLHEAALHEKGKAGIVIRELLKGYSFAGKVLRPAKVVVGSGEGEDEEASASSRP